MDIKGLTVETVMVTEGADIAEEYYFSLLLDRANRRYLAMASKEGGMEIEQLAVERPEALARIPVDPLVGIDAAKAAEIVDAAGFAAEVARRDRRACCRRSASVFEAEDATLVEVNPLVKTGSRRRSSPSTARSRWTRTPPSGTPSTRRWPTSPRRTRWRQRPRPRASTTSSSTARSASSATAPGW